MPTRRSFPVREMTDADVFGKLSRIFETHALGGDDGEDLENLLEDFDPQLASSLDGRGTLGRTGAKST